MKTNPNDFELIVAQGKIPIWRLLLSVAFFSIMIWFLSQEILMFYYVGFNERTIVIFFKCLSLVAYCLVGGIAFAVSKTILIDVDKDLLISRYNVGMISKDVKAAVPKLEYVSVFLDEKEMYQVNLWYIGNRHYTMYSFDEKEMAFKLANHVANKLNLDLLDATDRGNNKWIEITKI
ncbi:hypothetical protein [Flavobacterium sp.]